MFISHTVFAKATLVECVLKSTYINVEVVTVNLHLIIKLLNFIIPYKAFNNTVKYVARYLI
jgi:hypothetical protein